MKKFSNKPATLLTPPTGTTKHDRPPTLFRAPSSKPGAAVSEALVTRDTPGMVKLRQTANAVAQVEARSDELGRRKPSKKAQAELDKHRGELQTLARKQFRALMSPMDVHAHWTAGKLEGDLRQRVPAYMLEAIRSYQVERSTVTIPIPANTRAHDVVKKAINRDTGTLFHAIEDVLQRSLYIEEQIAIEASLERSERKVASHFGLTMSLIAAMGLLAGCGTTNPSYRKSNYRIAAGRALFMTEDTTIEGMIGALHSAGVHADESSYAFGSSGWLAEPIGGAGERPPVEIIQCTGITYVYLTGEKNENLPIWSSLYPRLFEALSEDTGTQSDVERAIYRLASIKGMSATLEILSFENDQVVKSLAPADPYEEPDDLSPHLGGFTQSPQYSQHGIFRKSVEHRYFGRPLQPWEDPGETPVSFPKHAANMTRNRAMRAIRPFPVFPRS